MTYSFTFGFAVTAVGDGTTDPGSLETTLERLMEVLLDQEGDAVFDVTVGATLAEGQVEIDLSVLAPNEQVAAAVARDVIVDALAEVGGTAVGPFVFTGSAPADGTHTWHERRVELNVA